MRKLILAIIAVCLLGYGFTFLYTWRVDAMSGATSKGINTGNETNNFFDNADFKQLPLSEIMLSGEIKDSVKNLKLYGRSERDVIVKELVKGKDGDVFKGAFCYRGISLVDLLSDIEIKKAVDRNFKPQTDLFVSVENDKGAKVVFSWGELFYSATPHDIILAYAVAPVYPVKEIPEYMIPEVGKIVVKNDFYSNRNIENPTKITIHSHSGVFPGKKHQKPLYAEAFQLFHKGEKHEFNLGEILEKESAQLVHFGLHWGDQGVKKFSGIPFKEIFNKLELPLDEMAHSYFAIGSPDAYRAVFSVNEILNRADSKDVLLMDVGENNDGGRYKIHPQADFFADRTMKAVSRIYLVNLNKLKTE